MNIYIFNPDNDLALACNEPNYMPPASARMMASQLALLPVWYAEEDSVVVADVLNKAYLCKMQSLFQLPVKLISASDISLFCRSCDDMSHLQLAPWGWNLSFCRRLMRLGVPESLLPDKEDLQKLRTLSGRRMAVKVMDHLKGMNGVVGENVWIESSDECVSFFASHGASVFKAPWSGSGKGLLWCRRTLGAPLQAWCAKVIREQGGVVASPIYNKVCDFAMEFVSNGNGEVLFVGYSLFFATHTGAYEGNRLLSDEAIEAYLSFYISVSLLAEVRLKLLGELAIYYADYQGVLGVDMLICRQEEDGKYALFPCVEINARMNMGLVSHIIYQRYVAHHHKGKFMIEHHPSTHELIACHESDSRLYPLEVSDGRVVRGYLPLTPITSESVYRAYLLVE